MMGVEGSVFRYKCYWCVYCKYMSEESTLCEYFKRFVKPTIKYNYRKPKIVSPTTPM